MPKPNPIKPPSRKLFLYCGLWISPLMVWGSLSYAIQTPNTQTPQHTVPPASLNPAANTSIGPILTIEPPKGPRWTPESLKSSGEISAQQQQLMSEIEAIRAQLGGGLSEQLKGLDQSLLPPSVQDKATIQEKSPTAQQFFEGALRTIVNQETDAKRPEGSQTLLQHHSSAAVVASKPRRWHHQMPNPTAKQETLRRCAQQLEQVAAELERVGTYDDADQVRRQAQTLWTEARNQSELPRHNTQSK